MCFENSSRTDCLTLIPDRLADHVGDYHGEFGRVTLDDAKEFC